MFYGTINEDGSTTPLDPTTLLTSAGCKDFESAAASAAAGQVGACNRHARFNQLASSPNSQYCHN
jgi:hypothetical protein